MTNLKTIDAETLLSQPMRQPLFLVDGLLAPGLYILAGAPKVGKSLLALWLCTRIVSGKLVWKFAVRSATVLYLCLEDDRQRIQNRLSEMVGSEPDDFSSLHFSTEAQMLTRPNRGGDTRLLRQLLEFTERHPDTRLIIIDTLQKVRTAADVSYGCDYNDLSLLKRFADHHHLTVLVIHHLRKMKDDDPLNRISGTTGIAGAADGTLVLIRSKRSESSAVLHCTERDIQMRELALEFNQDGHVWELCSDSAVDDPALSEEVLDHLLVWLREAGSFSGTAEELSATLRQRCGVLYPGNVLTRKMRSCAEELEHYGFIRRFRRTHDRRLIELERVGRVGNDGIFAGGENIDQPSQSRIPKPQVLDALWIEDAPIFPECVAQ